MTAWAEMDADADITSFARVVLQRLASTMPDPRRHGKARQEWFMPQTGFVRRVGAGVVFHACSASESACAACMQSRWPRGDFFLVLEAAGRAAWFALQLRRRWIRGETKALDKWIHFRQRKSPATRA